MTESATMFLTGPRVVKEALGEEASAEPLGGASVHERNGVCHFVAKDDADAVSHVREILDYLPPNASSPGPERLVVEPPNPDPERVRAEGSTDVCTTSAT